jgi:dethiobiotin synthetase
LMVELKLPLLLVAGSYVGTISHTLTALEVVTRRDLDVVAVAVSESERSAASLEDTVAVLARFSAVEVIGIPRLADTAASHPAFARIAKAIANLKRVASPPL